MKPLPTSSRAIALARPEAASRVPDLVPFSTRTAILSSAAAGSGDVVAAVDFFLPLPSSEMSSRTSRNSLSASPGLGTTRPLLVEEYCQGIVVMVMRCVGTFLSSLLRSYSFATVPRPSSTVSALVAVSASLRSLPGLPRVAFSRSWRTMAFMYWCWALARAMSVLSSKP